MLAASPIEGAETLALGGSSGDGFERIGEHAVAAIVVAVSPRFLHVGPGVPRADVLVVAEEIKVSAPATLPCPVATMLPTLVGANRIVATVASVPRIGAVIATIAITRRIVVAKVVVSPEWPQEKVI